MEKRKIKKWVSAPFDFGLNEWADKKTKEYKNQKTKELKKLTNKDILIKILMELERGR